MPAANMGSISHSAFTGSSSAGSSVTLVATNIRGALVNGQTLSDAGGVITAGTTISSFVIDGTNATITMSAAFDLGAAGVNIRAGAAANPSSGSPVIMNPFTGQKSALFDFDTVKFDITSSTYGTTTAKSSKELTAQTSTGGAVTGIGFGGGHVIGQAFPSSNPIAVEGFNDNYVPGVTMPDGTTAATTSVLMAIGGGRSTPMNNSGTSGANQIDVSNPYTIAPIVGFGNSGSRDGGTAGRGFALKTVTATGTVANGSAVETGFNNRSGVSVTTGQSVFGQNTTQTAAIS